MNSNHPGPCDRKVVAYSHAADHEHTAQFKSFVNMAPHHHTLSKPSQSGFAVLVSAEFCFPIGGSSSDSEWDPAKFVGTQLQERCCIFTMFRLVPYPFRSNEMSLISNRAQPIRTNMR